MGSTTDHKEGITFTVRVQPRSSRNRIEGRHGDALKIRLTARPVDDAANRMCIAFLAKALGVRKSSLSILSGHTSRTKRILLRFPDEKAPEDMTNQMRVKVEGLFDRQKTT